MLILVITVVLISKCFITEAVNASLGHSGSLCRLLSQSDSALGFVCLIRTGEQGFFSTQFLNLICK